MWSNITVQSEPRGSSSYQNINYYREIYQVPFSQGRFVVQESSFPKMVIQGDVHD